MTDEETVRAAFAAYRARDLEAALRLLADDFVFTSPQDDRIDRDTWAVRCFPTADRFRTQRLLEVTTTGSGVIALYECELQSGEWFTNVELLRLRDGLIVETQVYFGGRVPGPRGELRAPPYP